MRAWFLNGCKNKALTDAKISNPTTGFDDLVTQALEYELLDSKKKTKRRNNDDDSSSESFEEVSDSSSDSESRSVERKKNFK